MIYTFLTQDDITAAIREDQLNTIIDSDTKILKSAEKTAVIQIKSKIGSRYDMAVVFPAIGTWKETSNYLVGNYTYYNGKIYLCLVDNTGMSPAINTNDEWLEDDPRNQLLVTFCVDITLFHIHSRINRRKIPTLRVERYNEALEWLDMVKIGDETPDLPLLEGEGHDIPYGSEDPIDHFY